MASFANSVLNVTAGFHPCPAPQDAGQLQLVLRKQRPLPRQRNNQMDLPSLPRRQRALHGQRMQREFSFSAALLAPLATHFLLSFCRQGMVRCEVISQGSACVTCAGLWAKTLQTRASVFEHNRDVAGVRFELRYAASTLPPPSFQPPLTPLGTHAHTHTHARARSCTSYRCAAAPATFELKRRKLECCARSSCLSACRLPCAAS